LHKISYRDATQPPHGATHVTKKEPEVNSHDVISQMSGTNDQQLYEIFDQNLIHSSSNRQLSWQNVPHSLIMKSNMAAAAIQNFLKCQYLWGKLWVMNAK